MSNEATLQEFRDRVAEILTTRAKVASKVDDIVAELAELLDAVSAVEVLGARVAIGDVVQHGSVDVELDGYGNAARVVFTRPTEITFHPKTES